MAKLKDHILLFFKVSRKKGSLRKPIALLLIFLLSLSLNFAKVQVYASTLPSLPDLTGRDYYVEYVGRNGTTYCFAWTAASGAVPYVDTGTSGYNYYHIALGKTLNSSQFTSWTYNSSTSSWTQESITSAAYFSDYVSLYYEVNTNATVYSNSSKTTAVFPAPPIVRQPGSVLPAIPDMTNRDYYLEFPSTDAFGTIICYTWKSPYYVYVSAQDATSKTIRFNTTVYATNYTGWYYSNATHTWLTFPISDSYTLSYKIAVPGEVLTNTNIYADSSKTTTAYTAPPPTQTYGDWLYRFDGLYAYIIGYTGIGGSLLIPSTLNGYTVAGILPGAFQNNTLITSAEIPASITNIGLDAFAGTGLTSITFDGANTSITGPTTIPSTATIIAPSPSLAKDYALANGFTYQQKILVTGTILLSDPSASATNVTATISFQTTSAIPLGNYIGIVAGGTDFSTASISQISTSGIPGGISNVSSEVTTASQGGLGSPVPDSLVFKTLGDIPQDQKVTIVVDGLTNISTPGTYPVYVGTTSTYTPGSATWDLSTSGGDFGWSGVSETISPTSTVLNVVVEPSLQTSITIETDMKKMAPGQTLEEPIGISVRTNASSYEVKLAATPLKKVSNGKMISAISGTLASPTSFPSNSPSWGYSIVSASDPSVIASGMPTDGSKFAAFSELGETIMSGNIPTGQTQKSLVLNFRMNPTWDSEAGEYSTTVSIIITPVYTN